MSLDIESTQFTQPKWTIIVFLMRINVPYRVILVELLWFFLSLSLFLFSVSFWTTEYFCKFVFLCLILSLFVSLQSIWRSFVFVQHFFPFGWFSIRFPFDVNYVKIRIELDCKKKIYLHLELLLVQKPPYNMLLCMKSVSTWIQDWQICLHLPEERMSAIWNVYTENIYIKYKWRCLCDVVILLTSLCN